MFYICSGNKIGRNFPFNLERLKRVTVDYLWVLVLVKHRRSKCVKEGSKPFAFPLFNCF